MIPPPWLRRTCLFAGEKSIDFSDVDAGKQSTRYDGAAARRTAVYKNWPPGGAINGRVSSRSARQMRSQPAAAAEMRADSSYQRSIFTDNFVANIAVMGRSLNLSFVPRLVELDFGCKIFQKLSQALAVDVTSNAAVMTQKWT